MVETITGVLESERSITHGGEELREREGFRPEARLSEIGKWDGFGGAPGDQW